MNKRKFKVLFLTKYPEEGASSRYRVYQYLPHFKQIEHKSQSLLSEAGFKLLYQKGKLPQKIWTSLRDYLRRTFFILRNLDADLIYMQREVFAFGPLWIERLLKLKRKKLVFDLDDALFINKQNHNHPLKWDKAARVKKIIRRVDLVVAGNPWIKEECLKLGAARSEHIDVAEQIQEPIKQENPARGPLRALWLGSPTTCKYLRLIETALKTAQDQFPLEIYIVGGDSGINFSFDHKLMEWTKEQEQHYLSICDVGLMPLPMESWSQGKCGGKARTYMASGVVPVVSDIGYNRHLIKEGERGFLCGDDSDWIEALSQLHHNRDFIVQMRATNYDLVREAFDQEKIALQLETTIISCLTHE